MAIGHETPPAVEHAPTPPLYRFSVEQYLTMIERGVLSSDDRVELIDGWIVSKMTKNTPHIAATEFFVHELSRLFPEGYFVRKEDPIQLDNSVPEPDVVLIRGTRQDFRRRLPVAAEIALIVEVADTSLSRDRNEKLRIYADSGILNYWLINLVDSVVEVYADPKSVEGKRIYQSIKIVRINDELPVVIDGREVGRILLREVF